MAEVSASKVMELRGRTGLGMMECKKALLETGGDIAKAEDLLRIKSGAKASKAADRIAAEGVIGATIAADGKIGALLELNCETDFVARNADFVAFARKLAALVVEKNPADVAALLALPLDDGTVESARQALVQKLGENISVRRFSRLATPARLTQYLHGGRIGVMVAIEGGDEQTGKPADIVAKMVEGRISKYLAEVTLLGQPFAKDTEQTVEKYLKSKGATVRGFTLYVVGEGIERKKDDFAAEVAAMAKA